MMSLKYAKTAGWLVATALLGACAPSVSVSDLSRPNFGYQQLPHLDASFDPDPLALTNGLYSRRPLQGSCLIGYGGCAPPSRFDSSGWSP